jgi:pyruvate/2-oxoglutarate/acetoin dehydrogenase E1 component
LEDRSLFEVREELGDDEAGNATGEVVEIGKCQRVLKGDKGTIVAWGPSVRLVSEALGILKDQHLQLDLFDLQSLAPLDFEPIAKSCVRSGRLFVVEPCTATCSIGGELAARIMESCFDYLDAPVGRLNVDERIGYSPTLESSSIPQASDVADAIRRWLDA